jgi:hypothetical protein
MQVHDEVESLGRGKEKIQCHKRYKGKKKLGKELVSEN